MLRHRRDPQFTPIPLIEHATFAQVAAVTARKLELPEVVVQQVPTRAYPADDLAAHRLRLRQRDSGSAARSPRVHRHAGRRDRRPGRAREGRTTRGSWAPMAIATSSSTASGARFRSSAIDPPVDGQRLELTIDYDMQKALEDAFHAGNLAGAAVFMNPKTGEILAMTSLPAFDPERRSPTASTARRGPSSTPIRCCRCRTASSRASISRAPRSRSSSRPPR